MSIRYISFSDLKKSFVHFNFYLQVLQDKGVAARKVSIIRLMLIAVIKILFQTLWLMDMMFRWTPFGKRNLFLRFALYS